MRSPRYKSILLCLSILLSFASLAMASGPGNSKLLTAVLFTEFDAQVHFDLEVEIRLEGQPPIKTVARSGLLCVELGKFAAEEEIKLIFPKQKHRSWDGTRLEMPRQTLRIHEAKRQNLKLKVKGKFSFPINAVGSRIGAM